jgi:hypothetical protein
MLVQATHRMVMQRLSPERMRPYLDACHGDERAAIELYEWNLRASGIVYEALHVVEIVLRNAIHEELSKWHVEAGHTGSWLDNPSHYLDSKAAADIAQAIRRASKRRHTSQGHVVAELSFGFWRFLLTKRYADNLWRLAIRHAFPNLKPAQRHLAEAPVTRLLELRNRIAHLEPIHQRDLSRDHHAILSVIVFICDDTKIWAKD